MAFLPTYFKDFGVPVVVLLRYFGGFSSRSSFSWSGGHIPIFVNQILNDEEVTIHGDGSQSRSMAYVDDLISAPFWQWRTIRLSVKLLIWEMTKK